MKQKKLFPKKTLALKKISMPKVIILSGGCVPYPNDNPDNPVIPKGPIWPIGCPF